MPAVYITQRLCKRRSVPGKSDCRTCGCHVPVLGLQMSDYGAHPVRWELLLLTVPGGAGRLYVHVTTTLQWDPEPDTLHPRKNRSSRRTPFAESARILFEWSFL